MSGYKCTLCDGQNGPVVQLFTSLETGITVTSCQADLPVTLIGATAMELGVNPGRLYDAVKRFTDREARRAEAAADAAAAGGEGTINIGEVPGAEDAAVEP